AFVLLGLLPGLWGIGGALLLWGGAASVYHPAGLALISTGVRQRGRALAYHGIAGNVGIAGGPLVTALLLLVVDWPVVAVLLGLPALAAAAFAFRASFDERAAVGLHEETKKTDPPTSKTTDLSALWTRSRHLFASGFVGVFVLVALSGLYYRGMLTFLPDLLTPLVTVDLPIDVAAGRYVYAGLLAVGIGGQYVGGRLSDRDGTECLLAAGFAVLASVAATFLPLAGLGTGALLGVSALLGFFLFAVQPLYQATVAEYTPPEARGLSYGYTYVAVFGVGASGAALAGVLLQTAGPPLLFGVLAGIAVLGASLSAWLAVRQPAPSGRLE
ncbi:MAG: MFS transporter, partial [Salinibacter sp.]